MANVRAQSAMEYLMTYGWAIVIIAVVIAALFYLGVFNQSKFVGQSCVAAPGYICTNASLSGYTGNGVITIGVSATALHDVAVAFAPAAAILDTNGAPEGAQWLALDSASSPLASNTLYAGIPAVIADKGIGDLPVTAPNTPVGSSIAGEIWIAYTTNTGITACQAPQTSSPTCSYAQIGVVTFKAA